MSDVQLAEVLSLYSKRSISNFNLKEYKAALSDAEECIKLDPKWVEGYERKISALVELEQIGEAYVCYTEACALDPDNEALKFFKKGFVKGKQIKGQLTEYALKTENLKK